MRRNLILILALLAAIGLLAGCGATGLRQSRVVAASASTLTLDAVQEAQAPAGPTLGSQRGGDVVGWLSSEPVQPVRGAADLDAYLLGADGKPITDAAVTFDIDMTNMSHGAYLVTAAPAGEGHYTGNVHFSMPGPWRVIAIVERPGAETARLRFEFTVKMK